MGRLMNKDAVKIILESYDSGNLTQDALIDTIAYAQQDKVDKAVAKAIAALIKWLFEECTKHPVPKLQGNNNSLPTYHHHYRCWKCMEKLKESGL